LNLIGYLSLGQKIRYAYPKRYKTCTGLNISQAPIIKACNENLEAWKDLFENIVSRGVRRVLMVITDNFNGIEKVIKGYFPYL